MSVWGTDIYDFPNNGFIQKQIINFYSFHVTSI
ncbi:MAG: hypothetical protein E6X72_11130 [Clostridioides difficile]|nr:hypothetical protein [Clostridioides difficile]